MYRLCSPNYQGTFEFNVAKSGGSINYFSIYCTMKPYTPFIKVTPELNFLYGTDYNDNRGLICGGDFSLPRVSDAWKSYQLNNKNYQNIFNRDIQHLDFEQSLQMKEQLISGGMNILSDTIKGIGAGAMTGGVAGAALGGIAAFAGSGIGYAIDSSYLYQRQKEARSYAIDKYNYNLGNIKALPYTITKVGAFDVSSKIFPFLEYYTCTEEEKEALISKINYESMIVMRVDKLVNYYNFGSAYKYFKAELIRNTDIVNNSTVFDAINEEFLKGVFL